MLSVELLSASADVIEDGLSSELCHAARFVLLIRHGFSSFTLRVKITSTSRRHSTSPELLDTAEVGMDTTLARRQHSRQEPWIPGVKHIILRDGVLFPAELNAERFAPISSAATVPVSRTLGGNR